jgi:hypothetical protein
MIARFFDFAAGQVTSFFAARKNRQQHKVLRQEQRKMDELLEQHFVWDKFLDERYHCEYCSYNTQLANAAIRHYAKRHQDQVVDLPEPEPIQDQDQGPGQDQDPDEEQEPADLENSETEEKGS